MMRSYKKQLLSICVFFTFPVAEGFSQNPGKVLSYNKVAHGLAIVCENANVEISVLDSSLIYVHIWKDNKEEGYTPAVVPREFSYPAFSFKDRERLILATGKISVEIEKHPFRISFFDKHGNLLTKGARELQPDAKSKTMTWAMQPDEHFYGLGHKVRGPNRTDLSWRGHARKSGPLGNTLDSVNKSFPTNMDVPVLYSTKGWALFMDNVQKKIWDFTAPSSWSVQFTGGDIKYFFFYGPSLKSLVNRFTELTGRALLLPKWSFGLLQCKWETKEGDEYDSWKQLIKHTNIFRAHQIPVDGFIIDSYWFGSKWQPSQFGSWIFDKNEVRFDFSEAAKNIALLKKKGIKITLYQEPYLAETERSGHYQTVLEKDYCPQVNGHDAVVSGWWGTGTMLDPTNPEAMKWYFKQNQPNFDMGVEGFWFDLGEPDNYDSTAVYFNGKTHREVHNLYNFYVMQALHQNYSQQYRKRLFILSRSGYAGQQRFGAAIWSGDVRSMDDWFTPQTSAGLNVGLSGFAYWNTDIGGFKYRISADPGRLFARWEQNGAFHPIMRNHGHYQNQPYSYGYAVEKLCRAAIELRYRLLPYIYTTAREAYDTGMPMMRPLVLEYPEDGSAQDIGTEYLFGPAILVAPVTDELAEERDIYLPQGNAWLDWSDGKVYEGGQTLSNFPAPLQKIPLFLREGAIIPMGPLMQYVDEKPLDPLTVVIFPGGQSEYVFYEDDGESLEYLDGQFAATQIYVKKEVGKFLVEIAPTAGRYNGQIERRAVFLEIFNPQTDMPRRIKYNDELLAQTEKQNGEIGWSFDNKLGKIVIALEAKSIRERRRVEVEY